MKDHIGYVAGLLDKGYASTEEIREFLLKDGLSEAEAFYTFKAGQMIHQDRENHRAITADDRPTLQKIAVS